MVLILNKREERFFKSLMIRYKIRTRIDQFNFKVFGSLMNQIEPVCKEDCIKKGSLSAA